MEGIEYPLDHFEKKDLPNPRVFPVRRGETLTGIIGYPKAVSDCYAVCLNAKERDQGKVGRRAAGPILESLLTGAKKARTLLPEPSIIWVSTSQPPGYILGDTTVQIKYFRYFRNRSPKCKFYSDGGRANPVVVRVGAETIGLIMPFCKGV